MTAPLSFKSETAALLARLGVTPGTGTLPARSPITGETLFPARGSGAHQPPLLTGSGALDANLVIGQDDETTGPSREIAGHGAELAHQFVGSRFPQSDEEQSGMGTWPIPADV